MVDSFEEIFTLDVAKTARTDCFLDVFPNEKSEISTKDMLSFKRLLDQEAAKDFISASKQHAEDFSATEVEKNRSFSPAWYSELMFAAHWMLSIWSTEANWHRISQLLLLISVLLQN